MNSDDRLSFIKNLQMKYDPEPLHSNQVAKLSLQLFDELIPLHKLSSSERLLLEASALLHDIGYALQNAGGHHKNSLRIILEAGTPALPGFNPTETEVIANVARYHRKSLPSESHPYYAKLDSNSRSIVCKLAALLRIADGLDRSHRSLVSKIFIVIEPAKVIFDIFHFGELRNEITAAEKKSDLFEIVYERQAVFRSRMIQSDDHTKRGLHL
ncbi:MAG TPA: HD domain-containing protein [Candidatus Marinimicrobia bacterium]|nr:HD domain-containing protein [Candidatus Neomarinimicrobiota bacterium]HRS52002.1 HD domain-containing protein [Candidatus Neomarinimicrobiota bacterium]HRU91869.1 HD domain-containing protein [Candidatus Neomarinimicrobiota bacterium]